MREGACECIPGCVELIGVREGACMCIPGCVKLTGVREGACGVTHGMRRAVRDAIERLRVHTWLS